MFRDRSSPHTVVVSLSLLQFIACSLNVNGLMVMLMWETSHRILILSLFMCPCLVLDWTLIASNDDVWSEVSSHGSLGTGWWEHVVFFCMWRALRYDICQSFVKLCNAIRCWWSVQSILTTIDKSRLLQLVWSMQHEGLYSVSLPQHRAWRHFQALHSDSLDSKASPDLIDCFLGHKWSDANHDI